MEEKVQPESSDPVTISPSPVPATKKSLPRPNLIGIVTILLAVIALSCSLFAVYSLNTKMSSQQAQIDAVDKRIKTLEEADKYTENQVDDSRYQAVFLQNGSVYFGKITTITQDTLKLEEIYYLKTGSVDKSGNPVGAEDVSLVKLGNELHSPDDVMFIERKNVAFWENLNSDGQVVRAIEDYKASN